MTTATPPRPRVLCSAPYMPPPVLAELEAVADVVQVGGSRESILAAIGDCDVWWGHYTQKADAAIMDAAPRLRVINTTSTGTDHIDKPAAAQRGIRVLSIAKDIGLLEGFTATAECAFMLLLACHRNLRGASRAACAGDWQSGSMRFTGKQLHQKTLGIIGLGRLGTMTARFGHGFGMRVLGCDHRQVDLPNVQQVDLDTLLAESDAISLHIHMTPENVHFINASRLAQMKPGGVIVNTSRGDLIDEAALIAALESGHLAAYGADVVHDEWRPDLSENAIVAYAMSHDNVILTPHIGGATRESIEGALEFSARKLAHYLATGEELTVPSGQSLR